MTATPRYFTGRVVREAKDEDFEVASMDNEGAFGPVFHRLGFAQAIKRDLLTDYQVVVVGVDDATYRDWALRGRFVTIDGAKVTDARSLAGQIGVAKAMRQYDLHRTITFHSRVNRAREFCHELPRVVAWMPPRQRPKGQLWCDYVSGEMPAGQRHVLLQHLRGLNDGERGLLANARCLAEGVDVPTLDGVAFIDPRRSEVDIVQAVGRAIRLAPDKTVGTIIIPVFIDTDDDPEIALDDSAFATVWDVVKALRSHDEELSEQLDALRRQLGRRGRPRLPDKIHFGLPATVGIEFASAFGVRLVEQTTVSFEFWFGLLEQFVEGHGYALVPQSCTVNGYALGKWVNVQRRQYSRGALDADRVHRLEGLAGWTWDWRADRWDEGFSQLVEYVELTGDARVPRSYTTADGDKLGEWVKKQRDVSAKGVLEADRRRRLEKLAGWTWDPYADKWEERFSLLLDYVEHHGDALVPTSYTTDDGYQLGKWVAVQRNFYRDDTLEADRERRLRELPGWSWSGREAMWEEGFSHLLDYVQHNGDALVPVAHKADDGYPLGQWVTTQRNFRIKGTLNVDRERRLRELPGWMWNGRDAIWEEGFRKLLDYVEGNGDSLVPKRYRNEDGNPLGVWVMRQRRSYAEGTLDSERERRLKELPGWTWKVRSA
jgi:hypothetical protein